jgi:hypothetical protein
VSVYREFPDGEECSQYAAGSTARVAESQSIREMSPMTLGQYPVDRFGAFMTIRLTHVSKNPSSKQFPLQNAIKQWLLVAAMLATVCCDHRLFAQGNQAAGDGKSAKLRLTKPTLISDQNRNQDGVGFGGWGPHLRSVLRMNDDSLWYVMDHSKGDISSNDQLLYFQQKNASWKRVARQDLIPGAGQGYAHITNGEEIFSYGVNFRLAQLHECRLNAKTLALSDCTAVLNRSGQAIDLGGGANYVGAAISPKGTRLVWWVVVARDGTGQQWNYVYNRGDGWQGPIVTRLVKSRRALSYIYVRFVNENQVALSGQFWIGKFPEGSQQATLTHFSLGEPIKGFHTLKSSDDKGFPKSGSDLWVNPKTATIHALVEGFGDTFFGNKVHYYTFKMDDPWRELEPVQSFRGYFRARLTQIKRGDLFLVLGGIGRSKIDVLHVPKESITDPIDWNAANKFAPTMPADKHYAPMAIWIENRAYQTTAVRNLNFAFTGENPQKDHEIWFYSGTFK